MPTLTISSIVYDVYADNTTADSYLLAKFGTPAWSAATVDQQSQALVSATRLLDKQCWLGDKTDDAQALAWPRTNTGLSGVEDDVIPSDIISASIELAFLILTGSNVENNSLPGAQGLQVIKAGSVMLQYFRDAQGFLEQSSRFPTVVQEYIARYLCGSTGMLTGIATGVTTGTEVESITNEDYGYNDGI